MMSFFSKHQISTNMVYVFIDASNLWAAQKAKGKLFDYEKLRKYLKVKFEASMIDIFYYSAYPADGTREYSLDARHKFFTFLKKGLGFVVRKTARGYPMWTAAPKAQTDMSDSRCYAKCAARTSGTAGTASRYAKCAAHFA